MKTVKYQKEGNFLLPFPIMLKNYPPKLKKISFDLSINSFPVQVSISKELPTSLPYDIKKALLPPKISNIKIAASTTPSRTITNKAKTAFSQNSRFF